MRVVDLTEFYSPRGGVRTQLTLKGRAFSALGHAHLVIAPGTHSEDRPLDVNMNEEHPRARVVLLRGPTLPYDHNYQLLWRMRRVHSVLQRFAPDIISVNSLYMAPVALQTMPDCPRAVHIATWHADFIDNYVCGFLSSKLPKPATARISGLLWRWVVRLLNGYAATFTASKNQADKLRSKGVDRVFEIPYGVDRRVFSIDARSSAFRRDIGLSDPNIALAVAVGRLSGEKNWDVLLQAVQCTKRNIKLLIYGAGPELDRLRALADPRRVIFMGFEPSRERLAMALASADVFLNAAPHETYGFGIAEAIACGTPVVVSSSGAAIDMVQPSHGRVCPHTSACDFAEAIEVVTDRNSDSYRAAALQAAATIPDYRNQMALTASTYESLIEEHQRSRKCSPDTHSQCPSRTR